MGREKTVAEMQDLDGSEEVGEIEAVEQQATQSAEEAPPAAPELPDRYRNKSVEDIVRMHQEAEKMIGRQAQEVGEIRKLADELLRSQLATKPKQQEEQQEVDFFANPQEAIRRAVETHPEVQNAKGVALQVQRTLAQQALVAKHPDMPNLVRDPDFVNWVRGSPVRMRLFQEADAYNVESADELLSTYKELRGKNTPVTQQQPTVQVDKQARDQMLKTAAVDTGGSGEMGKKVYRRADLIRLKISNPSKYDAMQEEISAAYREGRVK